MKIMATLRSLPILLAGAIMAVSCTGVQDEAQVTPTPTNLSVKGEYTFTEVIDSIQTEAKTETQPATFFYLKREYYLELSGNSETGSNEALLFITEWASPDRVFITTFKGSYTLQGNAVQLVFRNMTLCDGIDIIANGTVQQTSNSLLKLSLDHCPPANKRIELTAEASAKGLTANSTTHN